MTEASMNADITGVVIAMIAAAVFIKDKMAVVGAVLAALIIGKWIMLG